MTGLCPNQREWTPPYLKKIVQSPWRFLYASEKCENLFLKVFFDELSNGGHDFLIRPRVKGGVPQSLKMRILKVEYLENYSS